MSLILVLYNMKHSCLPKIFALANQMWMRHIRLSKTKSTSSKYKFGFLAGQCGIEGNPPKLTTVITLSIQDFLFFFFFSAKGGSKADVAEN